MYKKNTAIAIVLSSIAALFPKSYGAMQQHLFNIGIKLSEKYKVIGFSSYRNSYKGKIKINKNFEIIEIFYPSIDDFGKKFFINKINRIITIIADIMYYQMILLFNILRFNNIKLIIFIDRLHILAIIISKIIKKKIIFFEGNEFPWQIYPFYKNILSYKINLILAKLDCKFADLIIAQNISIKTMIEKITNKKAVEIPISIDIERFKPQPKNGKSDALIVGILGRLMPEKGIPLLLNVIKKAENYPFLKFIVFGSGIYEQEFKKRKNVLMVKSVRREELPDHINLADVFISAQLAIGMAEAEILACGKPLLILKSETNKRWIKDGYNGFLCENEEDYLKILKYLYENWQELEKLSKNARNSARSFSVESISEQWDKLIEELI